MRPPLNNHQGAKGLKRKGERKYGRAAMSNNRFFADTIPSKGKRARRMNCWIGDCIDLAGGNVSPIALDYLRSAAMVQWELDQVEAAPELDRHEHGLLTARRDGLLRRANVIASTSHHPIATLPGAANEDEEGEAA
jgi:hypothetical protein